MMSKYEINLVEIVWQGGKKSRPALVFSIEGDVVKILAVTSKYVSEFHHKHYYVIKHWCRAGLDKPSYIDTSREVPFPMSYIKSSKLIGSLVEDDVRDLLNFIKYK